MATHLGGFPVQEHSSFALWVIRRYCCLGSQSVSQSVLPSLLGVNIWWITWGRKRREGGVAGEHRMRRGLLCALLATKDRAIGGQTYKQN